MNSFRLVFFTLLFSASLFGCGGGSGSNDSNTTVAGSCSDAPKFGSTTFDKGCFK